MNTTRSLLKRGVDCLKTQFTDDEIEQFLREVILQEIDYSEWREQYLYAGMTLQDVANQPGIKDNKYFTGYVDWWTYDENGHPVLKKEYERTHPIGVRKEVFVGSKQLVNA
jgi:hypothetical protein